jgi:hypothetical protein
VFGLGAAYGTAVQDSNFLQLVLTGRIIEVYDDSVQSVDISTLRRICALENLSWRA